jgi:hypothetical protein
MNYYNCPPLGSGIGALVPTSILVGLQGFVQSPCYTVHHKGLIALILKPQYTV